MVCPRCGSRKSWILKSGRRRCARCRFDWTPGRLPLRLTLRQWRALLQWFVRGLSSAQIAHETGLDRKRVLRALMVVRREMARSLHVDVSDTSDREPSERRADGSQQDADDGEQARPPRSAVLGLQASSRGIARAEVLSDVDAERVACVLRGRKDKGPITPWLGMHRYAAVVFRGRLYRLTQSGTGAASRFGHVESFWSYLQRRLKAKGGVRRQHLGLYLAEYAWRYNHRNLSASEQLRECMKLVRQRHRGGTNAP